MLDYETKKVIDSARNILVGKLPSPNTQVEQITLAMLYKFMDDIDQESLDLGGELGYFSGDFEKYSWRKILNKSISSQTRMNYYIEALEKFYYHPQLPKTFRDIFKDASVPYRDPEVLSLFLREIDNLSYYDSEKLGDSYEYLLMILGSQGDLGQFRTPRHIIDFIVDVVKPTKNDRILDPACGTAGFLISSYKYVANDYLDSLTFKDKNKILENIVGYDIEPSMVRISEMNMYLHGCSAPNIYEYDTLSFEEKWDDKYEVILANPPFMTPKGGVTPHNRFSIQSRKAEVLFVDYILEHLTKDGRTGFIIPEGIISNNAISNIALRKKMIENGLYAVIALHPFVFKPYSGVSTHIIFIDKKYKNVGKIYIRNVDEDGFEKGESRSPSSKLSDLPSIKEELDKFRQYLENQTTEFSGIGRVITKDEYGSKLDFHPNSYYDTDDIQKVYCGDIFDIEKGTLQSSKRIEGEYSFITASDTWLNHNEYTHDKEALIFVFGAGGSLGKVHYVKEKFVTSDLCYILTPKNNIRIDLKYYYAYFNANRKKFVRILARGTNKKSISDKRLRDLEISCPDYEEQKRVGKIVLEKFNEINSLKSKIEETSESLFELVKE